MRYGKGIGLVGVFLLSATFTVKADPWDPLDNTSTSPRNHLIHESEQVHDVAAVGGVADEDWFLVDSGPYSSYQLLVDGTTVGFAAFAFTRRTLADPTTNLQSTNAISGGQSLQMVWQNDTNTGSRQVIRGVGACSTTCTADAQYRIRLLDTTYLVPRFNNANSQVTVLLAQNSLGGPVSYTPHYFSTSGTPLASAPATIPTYGSAVVNLSTIPALQNQTGTIIITHNAGYGGLAVKTVALEPATGFSFDTPGTYRHR